jgi:M6 family metalloprotease-like protein
MPHWFRFPLALVLALMCVVNADPLFSAPLHFVPQVVIQPDGAVIHCFASGDEYYSWLHDAAGFTIVKDPVSGYFVYAEEARGDLVPSRHVVGLEDPVASGLRPWMNISTTEMAAMRTRRLQDAGAWSVAAPTAGSINNLVIFMRCSDDPEFTDQLSVYNNMYNASTAGISSMYNYFQDASYGLLSVQSTFYPSPVGGKLKSYKDTHTRGYFSPYDASSNPLGYKNELESSTRENALLAAALNYIAAQVPTSLNIDGNNDGYVDNICFIMAGTPTAWSTLLWPHMSWLSQYVTINGKRVRAYNLQIRSSLLTDGASVLSHEMTHSLGAPDLYHYTSSAVDPVGSWDLMSANSNPPQHMGAYMKYKYLGWVNTLPTISAPGTYALRPLTSPDGNCFKIPSPYSHSEYFVVEYRKKTGLFESRIPGEGLLVYRINGTESGNAQGPPDEVYIYRPGGSLTVSGSLNKAAMNAHTTFAVLDDESNPRSFLSTGMPGGLCITNVGELGDSITFTVGWPRTAVVDTAIVTAYGSDSVVVTWDVAAQCRCKSFEIQRARTDSANAFQTVPDNIIAGDGTLASAREVHFVDHSNTGELFYRLKITDTSDVVSYSRSFKLNSVTSVKNAPLVVSFALEQNWPNPFNPRTVVSSQYSVVSDVRIVIYDMLGREVAVLVNERRAPGRYHDTFDGTGLASGVYVYRLTAGGFVQSKTMVLLK